jgi:hypothetical protein
MFAPNPKIAKLIKSNKSREGKHNIPPAIQTT